MSATSDTPLSVQIREAQLDESDAALLLTSFSPFFEEAQRWRQKAAAITVTSVADKQQMSEARKVRLALKDIRVDVEHARKKLKEESLRKGKAIDGMANVIKFLIVPIEEELEAKEKFAEMLLETERQKLKAKREQEILAYGADPSFYNLAEMPEDTYQKLLESSKTAHAAKREAEERAKHEAAERERAEAEERDRIRAENERLRAVAEVERAEREKAQAELRAKREAEEKAERERVAAENKRIEQEKRARLAPDRDKLIGLSEAITATAMPEVSSEEAKAIISKAVYLLAQASQYVKAKADTL